MPARVDISAGSVRAWWATHLGDYEESALVFAETEGQAKRHGSSEIGCDFVDVRLTRYPKADAFAERGYVPDADGLRLNIFAYVYCAADGCSHTITEDGCYRTVGGAVYCLKCYIEQFADGVYPEGTYCTMVYHDDDYNNARQHYVYDDAEQEEAWQAHVKGNSERWKAENKGSGTTIVSAT